MKFRTIPFKGKPDFEITISSRATRYESRPGIIIITAKDDPYKSVAMDVWTELMGEKNEDKQDD